MKMEYKEKLAYGTTCYDRSGVFIVVDTTEEDVGTDVMGGARYTLLWETANLGWANFTPCDKKNGSVVSLYWKQLVQEGFGTVPPRAHEWQPPKTKVEAAIRMAAGEVFAVRHKATGSARKLYTDENSSGTPFRVEYESGVIFGMTDEWEGVTEFTQ